MKDYIIKIVEKYITNQWKNSSSQEIKLKCPFHKGGFENKPSFFINTETGVYFCHTCNLGGPINKLLIDLGISREIVDLETAEIKTNYQEGKKLNDIKKASQFIQRDPYKAPYILSETILSKYHYCPTLLVNSGFDPKWLEHMEVGYDNDNNRITYPIRDIYGNLAGISGGRQFEWQLPKYKIYRGGLYDNGKFFQGDFGDWFDEQYPGYFIDKSRYIWNFDRVYARLSFCKNKSTIIICEGFKACLWLLQNGFINTVALFGKYMSDLQFNLVSRLDSDILLFLDNDDAGTQGSDKIYKRLRECINTRVVEYPPGKFQPDELTREELIEALG